VIVGVDRFFRVGDREAEQLVGAVGDHFVGVHVVAGARPGLERIDDELIVPLPGQHFVGGLHDSPRDRVSADRAAACSLVLEQPQPQVDLGGGALDGGLGPDERRVGAHPADREVVHSALGLSAPQRPSGHLDLAQGVGFNAEVGHNEHAILSSNAGARRLPLKIWGEF